MTQQLEEEVFDIPQLNLLSKNGFNGSIPGGLQVHPGKEHILYPVGSTIAIQNIETNVIEHLAGHTDFVTCIGVSQTGKYLASGQKTHMGFTADVIIWNFKERSEYAKLKRHMVQVQAVAFSPNDSYLLTLGGRDDGKVIVWNVATREPICGSDAQAASAGMTKCISFSNNSENTFVTAGDYTMRVWELDVPNRKIRPKEVVIGSVKRRVNWVEFEKDDRFFYSATDTGDMMAINMASTTFQKIGPAKELFEQGVNCLCVLANGDVLLGTGDGTVAVCKGKDQNFKRTKKAAKLDGAVTSIALRGTGHNFFVGTDRCNIYRFNLSEFTYELLCTSHFGPVYDINFPFGFSHLYVTCSYGDIRCWHVDKNQELLRIKVENLTCNAVDITRDGKIIVSGWSDGRIRGFFPESGKQMFLAENAHRGGVSALALLSDCRTIISGGREGSIRLWRIEENYQSRKEATFRAEMLSSLKEHRAEVTCIKVNRTDTMAISCSQDGSSIVWDLKNRSSMTRLQMIRRNTLFKYAGLHPHEHQFITTGTDHKIAYFEVSDGSAIRELEGSTGSINCLDISTDGLYFVSGGDDKLVKVWLYNEGKPTHVGIGHSDSITRVKISPDGKFITSVSVDGAILRWEFPHF